MTLFNKKLEITLGSSLKDIKLGYLDLDILPIFRISDTPNTYQIHFGWLICYVHIIYEKGEIY